MFRSEFCPIGIKWNIMLVVTVPGELAHIKTDYLAKNHAPIMEVINNWVESHPQDLNAHTLRIRALIELLKYSEAENYIEVVRQLFGLPHVEAMLGVMYYQKGEYAKALAETSYYDSYVFYATQIMLQKFIYSKEDVDKVTWKWTLLAIAECERQQGRLDNALLFVAKAEKALEQNESDVHLVRALIYWDTKDYKNAIQDVTKAIEQKLSSNRLILAYKIRAACHRKLGNKAAVFLDEWELHKLCRRTQPLTLTELAKFAVLEHHGEVMGWLPLKFKDNFDRVHEVLLKQGITPDTISAVREKQGYLASGYNLFNTLTDLQDKTVRLDLKRQRQEEKSAEQAQAKSARGCSIV